VSDFHAVLRLHQAELDRLAVQHDLAAYRYVKSQQFIADYRVALTCLSDTQLLG
jgi:hypothetical protein